LSIRNFHWDDLPALVNLDNHLRRAQGDSSTINEAFLKEFLGQPNLSPEEDCFLYTSKGEINGYALVCPEPTIQRSVLDLKVHPNHSGEAVKLALIRAALRRARDLPASVLHFQPSDESAWRPLLKAEGFSPVRVYWNMQWDLATLPSLELPQGFYIRTYGQPDDAEILTRIQNAAFGGSWGFSTNTTQEIDYRARMSITSHKGIIFLCHDHRIAGYCWTFILPRKGSTVGIISMIGIDPDFRQQRLGKPLLYAGLEYLTNQGISHVELEVDGQNGRAISLYHSVGFYKVAELQWFEASLESSSPGD
jgi:mycothiol synthase